MSNNFLTVHTRRQTSTDHLKKTDAAESIGDNRIRLWHHPKAKLLPVSTGNGKNRLKPGNGERWTIDIKENAHE
jgi:hypothetical protein